MLQTLSSRLGALWVNVTDVAAVAVHIPVQGASVESRERHRKRQRDTEPDEAAQTRH